jgi:hypothetical protein
VGFAWIGRGVKENNDVVEMVESDAARIGDAGPRENEHTAACELCAASTARRDALEKRHLHGTFPDAVQFLGVG